MNDDTTKPVEESPETTTEEAAPQDENVTEIPSDSEQVNRPVEEETEKQSTDKLGSNNRQPKTDNLEDKIASFPSTIAQDPQSDEDDDNPNARWYVIHTYSGHENKVAAQLRQRVESERLEDKILDVLVPTQDKIEIRGGKKAEVKEKIFPGYILVKMILDDNSWLTVRTTQGVTSFVGMGNKPTPISNQEVKSIIKFMSQGSQPTYKSVFALGDTVKIIDGPFAEFIGKVDNVDQDRGKVRVLVSIFGRETPVELDFLQVQKL